MLFMPKNLITLFSVFLLSISLAPPAFAVGQMSMLAPEDYDFSVLGGQNQSDAYKDLPPEAVLKVRNNTGNLNQLAGTTNTVFTFDGNGSTDAETSQRLLEVRFDFENDGRLDTYFSVTKVANHKYEKPGIKNIRMDVLDRAGNVSSITKKITVVENTPPLAHFSVSPKVGTTGTTFAFDTISSSDSQYNKNLLEYRFDFDTDGNFDTKFTSKTSYRHKFKEHGLKSHTSGTRFRRLNI
jgi:PKD repeat protein